MIQERYDEAELLLLAAREWLAKTMSPEHNLTQSMNAELVELYTRWHEREPDAGHDVRAAEWRDRLVARDE